jgi:hypothetical protein
MGIIQHTNIPTPQLQPLLIMGYGHHSTYQHTNTPTTTLTNHGVRLSMELGLFQPIEFDTSTQPLCFGYDQALFQVIRVGAFAIL